MIDRRFIIPALVFLALVAVAAGSRFAWIAPNFAAVSAAALLAGHYFRNRFVAAGVPILAMLVSDLSLGFYPWQQMLAVYGCLALPVVFGRFLGRSPAPLAVAGWSFAASCAFFIVTNFAVWLGGVYGATLDGLAACYIAALPFFKYTVAGDLFYAAALFGALALVRRASAVRTAVLA